MLPSPADLKGKILIKGKRPNPKKEAADEEEEEGNSSIHTYIHTYTCIHIHTYIHTYCQLCAI